MSINVKTLACNAHCASCYENEIRQHHLERFDFDAVKKTLSKMLQPDASTPCLHGGEPLLMGINRCLELFEIILQSKPTTGIQTNGLLIDDSWIDAFLKYKTCVGISLDGDTIQLNQGRGDDPAVVLAAIDKMRQAGISVSVISVLRRHNADTANLPEFIRFLKRLANEFGIFHVRTNPGIAFTPETVDSEQLTNEELEDALCAIAEVCLSDKRYMWQPVRDVVEMMMLGSDAHATCTFRGCDVWATSAETPILADGSLGNCMKGGAARDGVPALRASSASNARSEALRQIDCAGCEFWDICHGGCPGEAVDDDWRNKSRFCSAYKGLFGFVQRKIEGLMPSVYVGTGEPMINLFKTTWRQKDMKQPVEKVPGKQVEGTCNHGDSHGDRPHGDSNDPAWRTAHPEWGKK
jgi:uncharacterized protein